MKSSNKIQKIAKRIVKEDKEIFDTLLEFEKTQKIRNKTRLNFTIDKNIATKFRKYCLEKKINMSAKIQECMEKILKAQNI